MNSPFARRLGTNYCPPDDEVENLKTLLIESSLRMEFLDKEITKMQSVLDKLTTERDALQAFMQDHRALLSPIRRIPLEILLAIFLACFPTHRNCAMSASEAPVLLAHVCSSWRTILLSTPALWAEIHVVEPSMAHDNIGRPFVGLYRETLARRLEAIGTWLSRSGRCGLSISLQCSSDKNGDDLFLRALIPFASRWEHIDLTTSSWVLGNVSRLTEEDVPILKSVLLREAIPNMFLGGSWGLLRSSGLSKFSISSTHINPLQLPLRWNRLKDLSIESGSQIASVSALRIISWCPELRVCRLEVHDKPDDDGGGPQPVLTHTFLHTFDLNCAGTLHPMIHRFFSCIYFPELRHFTLRGSCESEEHLSFAPLLAAVPHLKSLDIGIEALPKSCLVELFHGLPPTMSRLHILDVPHSRTESHNNILALLTLFPTSFTLCCPSLNELRITDCMGFSDIGLLNLIKSRMEISSPRSRLKRVELVFFREMELDILPDLQPFIEMGLYIKLTYPVVTN
ncbi:hypothetical protein B0H14DRAFT_2857086 [Mycena olivaceomarginata]|nr:hypothetical protein B0H14DRAFT_2857086 [Mycena olivaceomarginata]